MQIYGVSFVSEKHQSSSLDTDYLRDGNGTRIYLLLKQNMVYYN